MSKYLAEGTRALATMKIDRGLSEFMETLDDGSVVCTGHIADHIDEVVAKKMERVRSKFLKRVAQLGWPEHLYKLANDDQLMEEVARRKLGLIKELGYTPGARRLADADLDTRPAHVPSGMPDPVWDLKDNIRIPFRAPKLFNFIKGLAGGFKEETWERVPHDEMKDGVKPFFRFVEDSLRPNVGWFEKPRVIYTFGTSFLVNGKRTYHGTMFTSNGEVHIFARYEDYHVHALVGDILLDIHYVSKGVAKLVKVGKASPNKFWAYMGMPKDIIPRSPDISLEEVLQQLKLGGLRC